MPQFSFFPRSPSAHPSARGPSSGGKEAFLGRGAVLRGGLQADRAIRGWRHGALALSLVVLIACGRDAGDPDPGLEQGEGGQAAGAPAGAANPTTPAPYTPPPDSLLSDAQLDAFLRAREALSRVGREVLSAAGGAGTAEPGAGAGEPGGKEAGTAASEAGGGNPRVTGDWSRVLQIAQEKACRRAGLSGLAEYRWISTEALRLEKNQALLRGRGVETAYPL